MMKRPRLQVKLDGIPASARSEFKFLNYPEALNGNWELIQGRRSTEILRRLGRSLENVQSERLHSNNKSVTRISGLATWVMQRVQTGMSISML